MSEMQRTLAKSASMSGPGLHTGNDVTLTLCPAAENTGYIFRRTDLKDEPTIRALVDNVKQVERATTIGEGNIKVHTVEHVLSALRGMGVDNAVIAMDSNEPPICDGSAAPYTDLIARAGVVEQSARREYFEVRAPVWVRSEDGGVAVALPCDGFEVSCTNVTHTGFHTQFAKFRMEAGTYEREVAPARTFVFYEEVAPLMEKGLIKGGSLENAVVIRGETILTREPARFPNEFARHKVLDIIGDLALFPRWLRAHIVALRTGHSLNVELARALMRELKLRDAQRFPVEHIPRGETGLDINEIMQILPHRYPFVMVDRIVNFEGDSKAIGLKNVSINEPYFQGHFPGHPVMPGVLQIEAMAQVASLLLLRRSGDARKLGLFMSADKVKFRRPVLPGDTIVIHVELTKARGSIGRAYCQCVVKGEVASEGELMFGFQDI